MFSLLKGLYKATGQFELGIGSDFQSLVKMGEFKDLLQLPQHFFKIYLKKVLFGLIITLEPCSDIQFFLNGFFYSGCIFSTVHTTRA